MKSIFISIANYRDPETVATLQSVVGQCSPDSRLRIVVLTQGGEADFALVDAWAKTSSADLRHIRIDAAHSEGACWARSRIQAEFDDEDYYLQLDSHIELAPAWDRRLALDFKRARAVAAKPIITAYLASYGFGAGKRQVHVQAPTDFLIHLNNGIPCARPVFRPNQFLPQPTLFFSAHFAFAEGRIVSEVPYDPELFFVGEEISLAVRAASAGYTMFLPAIYCGAHLYERIERSGQPRRLIWDEREEAKRSLKWWQRDVMSKNKVTAICRGEWFGRFGIADLDHYRNFAAAFSNVHGIELKRTGSIDPARNAT